MGKTVDLRESSKTKWTLSLPDNQKGDYPGDANIELGCLMRIADSVDLMAKNHAQLISDRDMYERWYKESRATINKQNKAIAALRGHLNRVKKLANK